MLLLLWSAALAGCNGRPQPVPSNKIPGQTPLTGDPTPAETIVPTSTPTPQPPLVVLWAPESADQAQVTALQAFLDEQAAQAGMRFQLLPQLTVEGQAGLAVVVALPPASDLTTLAAAHPQVQFLAVGIPETQPAANLSIIAPAARRPDQVGFLAGYLAASITPDWRTGVLTASGSPVGEAMRLAFANGVAYFCGLCLPVYPPYPAGGYPISVAIAAGVGPAGWAAGLNQLRSGQVETVFVDPALVEEQLLDDLTQAGLNYILVGLPPADYRATWVASLGYGDALGAVEQVWPGLLRGEGGVNLSLPLGIMDWNPDLLSPGRKRLAEEMLQELLAGLIDTGVNPAIWQGQ